MIHETVIDRRNKQSITKSFPFFIKNLARRTVSKELWLSDIEADNKEGGINPVLKSESIVF